MIHFGHWKKELKIISNFLGPVLPTKLEGHQMVRVGYDLVVIGGVCISSDNVWIYSKSLYKLSCCDRNCQWEELSQKLKEKRYGYVAVALPDDFLNCTLKGWIFQFNFSKNDMKFCWVG